ncbi:CsbD family protein [Sulfitobacter sp. HNIBRBA2951]|uniref:CsbD family protein n=1 Tax=Sulfitobacter aquimarinus TaxID=3158557 RepID=UPI0032DE557B
MNWDTIQGNWKQFKGQAQQNWGELTDDDLDRAEGNREELEGRIQEKYGKTKDEVKEEVDAFIAKL